MALPHASSCIVVADRFPKAPLLPMALDVGCQEHCFLVFVSSSTQVVKLCHICSAGKRSGEAVLVAIVPSRDVWSWVGQCPSCRFYNLLCGLAVVLFWWTRNIVALQNGICWQLLKCLEPESLDMWCDFCCWLLHVVWFAPWKKPSGCGNHKGL